MFKFVRSNDDYIMADYDHPYFSSDQRNYDAQLQASKLEDPIFPISRVGSTYIDHDRATGKNIIQQTEAQIRGGTGVLQLILTGGGTVVSAGAAPFGKNVREQLKEMVKHNQVTVVGVELSPNKYAGMSGFNAKQGNFSEQQRNENLHAVKDAISFVADTFAGGGTDLVSFEYQRTDIDTKWNKDIGQGDKHMKQFELYPGAKDAGIQFVAEEGKIQNLPRDFKIDLFEDPNKPGKETPESFVWTVDDMRRIAKDQKKGVFEVFKETYVKSQTTKAEATFARAEDELDRRSREIGLPNLIGKEQDGTISDKESRRLKVYRQQERDLPRQKRESKEQISKIGDWNSIKTFALGNVTKSYADAAFHILDEQEKNESHLQKDLYVGPEIGWPTYYGGHPDEFIEVIKKSRKEFSDRLQNQEWRGIKYTQKQADKMANAHIRGCFDTGHMGMWLKHFRQDLPYNERVEKFNDWYKEQVTKIAKADVVGTIQLVDAYGGEHQHLPPGQGIYPLQEAMKIFAKNKFAGTIVSEGHEEEKFGKGRITSKAYEVLGNRVTGGKFSPPRSMAELQQNPPYWGNLTSGTQQMIGRYTPPNADYKSWTEIPFE
jgi:hypothetical protein